ncbi:MAG: RDD family protein [Smithella sp.]
MLIIQWIGILVVGGIAFFLAKGESLPTGLSSIQSTVTSPPSEKPKVNESGKFLGGIYHPWRRYFARWVDYITGGLLAYFLFYVVCGLLVNILFPDKIEVITKILENPIIASIIISVLWMPIEAALLSTVGNTPGKWLFGISVRTTSGQILSFSQALDRSFRVLISGEAICIPVVLVIPEIFAYRRLTKTGTTLWDTAIDCTVTHKTWSVARTIACIGTFVFILILMGLLNMAREKARPQSIEAPEVSHSIPKLSDGFVSVINRPQSNTKKPSLPEGFVSLLPPKETQEATHKMTAEDWVKMADALWSDGKYTDTKKAIEYLTNAIKIQPDYARPTSTGRLLILLLAYINVP